MEVVSARSALLSNYEVLTLLKELESEQLAKAKTAVRVKKEEERALAEGDTKERVHQPIPEVNENLRTVEFEAIQYLTAEYQPIHSQSEASISKLVKDLAPFDFTKAEKLQIVNLAPTEAVELYVIVEEIEDRLGDKMEDVLEVVKNSLAKKSTGQANDSMPSGTSTVLAAQEVYAEPDSQMDEDYWGDDANEEEFVDQGEGAGIEGDLEMDDD